MAVVRVVPDLPATDVERLAGFYGELLEMEVAMSHGWIATLTATENPQLQLSLLRRDATAPVEPALSVEVSDVDAAHERATALGAKIAYPLTNEPWGVRRFFVEDPDGNVVNLLQHRPAS